MKYPVIIIGGGISGLRIASLLHEKNIPFKILEARNRIGGRIYTHIEDEENYFDLGPTWYWPDNEPVISGLVQSLKLPVTPQYNSGKSLLETNDGPPKQIDSSEVNSFSMRFTGGVKSLVDAVKKDIPASNIQLNTKLTSVSQKKDGSLTLTVDNLEENTESVIDADRIVLTLPPRLLLENVTFTPELPANVHMNLFNKPTWMGAQAKILVTYSEPFWKEAGLSGNAISWQGPLREIYDASTETGYSALFGFFSLTPVERASLTDAEIKDLAIEQFTRLFGEKARSFNHIYFKDWSKDKNMTTPGDKLNIESFPAYGQPPKFSDRIYFSGTEFDDRNGGHLEGALRSAEFTFNQLISRL